MKLACVCLLGLLLVSVTPQDLTGLRGSSDEHQEGRDLIQMIPSLRIVGGTTAFRDTYTSFAYPTSGYSCGATAIHEDILVTAAHCEPSQVFAGSVNIGGIRRDGFDARETIAVKGSRKHPKYDDRTVANDIMVLKLAHPTTAIVKKWNTNSLKPEKGEVVTVIGFGTTSYLGELSSELLEVDLDIYDFDTCNGYWQGLDRNTQICAAKDWKDSCQGDSGGPMFDSDGLLVGLVSFGGAGCGEPGTPPGVYTRLSGYDDFLTKSICEMSANPPASCNHNTGPAKPETQVLFINAGSASEDLSLISANNTGEIFSFVGRQPSLGVFNSIRYNWVGDLTYTIPNLEKSTEYIVKLGWAETYDYRIGCVEGFRVFDVVIQGSTVETDLDVYKTAGCAKRLLKAYQVQADSSGEIAITFRRKTYWPMVSVIEILTT